MTKEVEDIIKNKAYIELTDNERERVGEWAQNEEEYNNMKWFLTGTAGAFSSGKIQASPGLKKGVMQHLTESKKKKGFWLNSVGVFMLPEGKKFYQKPAFQLGVAAVAVVGFLFFFNNNLDEDSLAVNDEPVNTDTVIERVLDADNNEQLPAQDLANEDAMDKGKKDDPELEISTNGNNSQHFFNENANHSEGERDRIFEVPMEEVEEDGYMDYAPAPVVEKAEEIVAEVEDVEADVVNSMDEVTMTDDEDYRELNESLLRGNESQQLKDAEGTTNLGQTVTTESDDNLLFKRDNVKNKSERADVERKKRVFNKFSDNSEAVADMEEEASEEEPGAVVGGADVSSGEWIVPKSMHINKTKELNQLFHIEK